MQPGSAPPHPAKYRSEFPLKPTKNAILLALFVGAVAVYLFKTGHAALRQFHPEDPARLWFALPPMILAACLVVLVFWLPAVYCQGKIQLDLMGVHYYRGRGRSTQHFPWQELLITAPLARQKGVFRKLLLVNRTVSSRDAQLILYDLFLPHFDELASALSVHRQRESRGKDSVLSLD